MKKKIGIITFHASHNCGSMLQALALQRKVDQLANTKSEIIDFSNKRQQRMYSIFVNPKNLKEFIKNILSIPFYGKLKKHYNSHLNFIKNYFNLTEMSYETQEQLKNLNGYFEYWICGSDQIWNITCGDADDAYFLNFVTEGIKIAYAPSLGAINIVEKADNIEKYKKYISEFSALSIRELNGKRRIEELVNRNVELLLDPTLLMLPEEWDEYISQKLYDYNYIFYYAFHYSPEVNKIVKSISKNLKIPVIILDVKAWGIKGIFLNGFKISKEFGPIAFLNLIKNANLVLTTSFHGTVFSVLYKKKFWYISSSMHNKDDDRAITLLNQVNLTERLVNINEIEMDNILSEIDFSKTTQSLNRQRQNSINFLKKSLNVF